MLSNISTRSFFSSALLRVWSIFATPNVTGNMPCEENIPKDLK